MTAPDVFTPDPAYLSQSAPGKTMALLRTDLLERVFRLTRDAGFQKEKYRSPYLPIRWTREQLIEILDKRISYLIRQHYTTANVGHRDILDFRVRKVQPIDYMLERTSMRPRELMADDIRSTGLGASKTNGLWSTGTTMFRPRRTFVPGLKNGKSRLIEPGRRYPKEPKGEKSPTRGSAWRGFSREVARRGSEQYRSMISRMQWSGRQRRWRQAHRGTSARISVL